jgi:Fe-S cluster biogenesis protein NfuA/glutaredoxin
MLGTLLRRVTIRTLDVVVDKGRASQRAPIRLAVGALDRARGLVGLDAVRREQPMPPWSGNRPDQPMWGTDRKKLHKHRLETGIIKEEEGGQAAPTATPKVVLEMYFKRGCPYTRAAMELLKEREIACAEHDVTGDRERVEWLKTVTGSKTTPQLFVHGKSIGGYDELRKLESSGELRKMMDAAPGSEDAKAPRRRVSLPVVHPERSPFEDMLDDFDGDPAEVLEGNALVERVREVLEECRPMIQADGGDLMLLDIVDDVVHVELTGNCIGCPSSQATLRQGIERRLVSRIPQVRGIASPQLKD